MKYVSIKITSFMIKHGAIFNDRELFEFGLRTYLRNALIFTLSFIISLYFEFSLPFLVFNISFLILRQCTGGYHAKSITACFFESLILSIGIPVFTISYLDKLLPIIFIISSFVCSLILYRLTIQINMRKKGQLLTLLLLYNLTILMSSSSFLHIAISLAFAIISNLFFFLLAYIKERK